MFGKHSGPSHRGATSILQIPCTCSKSLPVLLRQQNIGVILRRTSQILRLMKKCFPHQTTTFTRSLRRKKGFKCAAFDWDYDSDTMDFLGRSGFLFLGLNADVTWPDPARFPMLPKALPAHHPPGSRERSERDGSNLFLLGHASKININAIIF